MSQFAPVELKTDDKNPLFRYFAVRKADMADENTFQVRMSSEFPGEQVASAEYEKLGIAKEGQPYTEILSHNEGDVDLTRFVGENRAPLLDEHHDNRHLGFIKTAALSTDKAVRGVVVFDKISKLSKTRCAEVAAESRPNFSLGYKHTRYLGPQTLEDGKIGHRFAFQALELSNVAVPMDPGAQTNRSAKKTHCIRCGDPFDRSDLNEDFVCADCLASEEPADEGDARKAGERMFRVKKSKDDGEEFRISHNELKSKVHTALDSDKRFKEKRENGDQVSSYYHHDIHQTSADGNTFQAIIQHPAWSRDSKYYAVDLTYDGKDVSLGEHTEVEPKQTWAAVERGMPFDAKQFRVAEFDSKTLPTGANTPTILTRSKNMDATPPTITPEIVIDNLDNPHVRSALVQKGYVQQKELEAAKTSRKEKLAARNKEITSLEAEFCRDFGTRIHNRKIADGKTEAQYLRDGIHIAAMEACAFDDDKSDSEVRSIFRSKVDAMRQDSVSEENIKRAANSAEDGLAGKCDDMFGTIKRTIKLAHERGIVSNSVMPDGAEAEYTDEMKKFYRNMPGSARIADLGGFAVPPSKGRAVARKLARNMHGRITRDALAGDFATAGAMVAPEFHPYIELLRNKIVLSLLGCTYIGGCTGEQVFPRQEAATVAQSLPEGQVLNPYDQTLGQIKMSPHRIGSRQYYSRLALIQAPPDFESMVWNDHAKVLALYQDEMGLAGSGNVDQPIGILNQPGISQLIFGGTPTYQSILNFRTYIRKFNVDGPLSFATTSVGQGRLAYLPEALNGSTVITQGSLDALWKGDEIDGEIIGCKAVASQQIPGDILLAGVFEELILASWGGIFTILDNLTRAAQDEVAVTFNTYFDIAVRHAQAFCRSLDSVNQ